MSRTLLNLIEPVLNLTVVDDSELLVGLNAVYNQIVNNPLCLGQAAEVNGVQTAMTAYAAAVSAALRGGPAAELERDQRRAEVILVFQLLAKELPDDERFVDTDGALSTKSKRRPLQLLSRSTDGKRYCRPPHVESELWRMLGSDPATWTGRAGKLQCETLVRLIRLTHDHNSILCGELIEKLRKRIAHRMRKFCGEMDEYDTEEFLSAIDIEVLELVLTKEPSRQRDFLEVRFGMELKRLAGKHLRKFENSTAGNIADIAVDRSNIDDAEESEEVERPLEFLPDLTSGPEDALLNLDMKKQRHRLLLKALRAVTDRRHREAVILHHGRGIPIFSSKRGKKCLTRHFRKKEREIRYWIDQAMEQLRGALGIFTSNPTRYEI